MGILGEFYRSFARSIDLQKSFGRILSILTCQRPREQRTSAHPWTQPEYIVAEYIVAEYIVAEYIVAEYIVAEY